ncbi:MAG: DUF2179 domain-containing protein [Anaerolineales bacterium]|nr:DUF2179 domain-containing protein [Anaerolineales bacterium]MCX7754760.1 DUF2179 domain-containing protein [Anaerolineales bacterium]MDW8278494.1 DUF2179 domain-containing protein [Anaerolineales bacterium]
MESFDWYALVILPILVFIARFVDVTLGTMRIIFTSRGRRRLAPLLGFIEVFIWIAMVGQIVKSANSLNAYLGYAAGFALGTYVGMLLEERLAMGTLVVRVILSNGAERLVSALREAGFGVTAVNGEGAQGPVKLLYTVVQRKNLEVVTRIIHDTCPGAFFAVEEVRLAERGIFPVTPGNIGNKT